MAIEITGPAKVRLRNGFECDVTTDHYVFGRPVIYRDLDGGALATWTKSGRRFDDRESRLDIVAILDPQPEPVIDGPGLYVVQTTEPGQEFVRTVKPSTFAESAGEFPWECEPVAGYEACFRDDGTANSPYYRIIRKHVPAPVIEPTLEEELEPGLWWLWNGALGCRVKVRLSEHPDSEGVWIAAYELNDEPCVAMFGSDGTPENSGNPAGFQLIRRVKEPTTRPYALDEVRDRIGQQVESKDGQFVCVILSIDRDAKDCICLSGKGWHSLKDLLEEWVHPGDVPCGIVEGADPWDQPAP